MENVECQVRKNGINLLDSYRISKKDFSEVLEEKRGLYPQNPVWNRSIKSLKREWALHNFLYLLGVARKKTKHVFLDYPQKWYARLGYFVFGSLSMLFIK